MPTPPVSPRRMPFEKYRPFLPLPIELPGRRWPDVRIEKAPLWCSVDLRDGNQALIDPMDPSPQDADVPDAGPDGLQGDRSRLPSASQPDYDFVRQLIEEDLIPDDVTIQVLVQCRAETDRPDLRVHQGFPSGHRPLLQLDVGAGNGESYSASTRRASPRSR